MDIDIMKLCRTCLQLNEDHKLKSMHTCVDFEEIPLPNFNDIDNVHTTKSITKMKFSNILAIIADTTTSNFDNLPNMICPECAENIVQSYKFKIQCEKSFEKLKLMLKEPKSYKFKIIKDGKEFTKGFTDRECKTTSENVTTQNRGDSCMNVRITRATKKKLQTAMELDKATFNINEQMLSSDHASDGKSFELIVPNEENLYNQFNVIDKNDKVDDIKAIVKEKSATKEILNYLDPSTDDYDDDEIFNDIDDYDGFTERKEINVMFSFQNKKSDELITDEKHHHRSKYRKPKNPQKIKDNQCHICNAILCNRRSLVRHMITHSDIRPFECSICKFKFKQRTTLNNHKLTHGENWLRCTICDIKFSFRRQLRKHNMNEHATEYSKYGNFHCDICLRSFTSIGNIKSHMKIHSTKHLYTCKYCTETFELKLKRHRHMRNVHQNEFHRFLCTVCGSRYSKNAALVMHMRSHTGERPFRCKYCDKGFLRPGALRVHEKYHTNIRPYVCSVCGKAFHRAYNLEMHLRTHTGERPYKCTYCTSSFAQSNDLKIHIRRHTGERIKCDLCDIGFIQNYQLKQHKRDVHGRTMVN